MSEKCEDGIWLLKGISDHIYLRFVKDGHCSIAQSEGELQSPSPLDLLPWTPIRRVADLDGRPVVEASVIEAEPAERPIVDLRKFGAFPCWEYLNGDEWTCYPSGSGHTRIRHRDGYAIWSAMPLNETLFTRTPPSPTLPPEQERLVGPIARKLGKTEAEVRDAILEAQGAGA